MRKTENGESDADSKPAEEALSAETRAAGRARPLPRELLRGVAIAALAVAAAAVIRIYFLSALESRTVWLTFYPAIMAAALFGGPVSGLLAGVATCLVAVFGWQLFIGRPFINDSADWLGLWVFMFNCAMISIIAEVARRANARAARVMEKAKGDARMRNIVEGVKDYAIIRLDPQGRVASWNEGAGRINGYAAEEIIGKHFSVFHPEEDVKRDKPGMELAVALKEGRFEEEGIRVRRDGSRFAASVVMSALNDEAGRPEGFLKITRDITERRRAEDEKEKLQAQLVQAHKMEAVGRLAGGVAHDINNMLSVIIGHSQLAMMDMPSSEPLYQDLLEILTAGERSANLTRQLMAFARRQTVRPIVLDINDTVMGMLKMIGRLIGEDIDLACRPGQNVWKVKIDPGQMDQLLANLTINARDAIAGVGKVTIETHNAVFDEAYCAGRAEFIPGEYAMLVVSDNGCGMDKETLEHIFEPFFTTKEMGKGTGLGLATVFGIVKQNNGFINVYSEPGEGTTFKIYLPRYDADAADTPARMDEKTLPTGGETVLIVEDEATILNLAGRILEGQGYTVLAAGAPGDAIRLATEHTNDIHLLLTDVVMPEMNGRELSERITAIRPGIKCLYMSGYTANVIAHHGVLDEGICFVPKPLSVDELARKVRETIDK